MKTLIVIFAHSTVNDTVRRHWPWYLRGDCDILGVGRTNTRCEWPTERLIHSIAVGIEGYASGDNHILRFLETLTALLTDERYKAYGAFCLVEYDGIFIRPVPPIKPGTICAKLAGHRDGHFRGNAYYHTPWYLDRIMAGRILKYGFAMLKAGLIEGGFIDRWLGLMVDLYDIPIADTSTYTQNTIDTPAKIEQARTAIEAGAWYIHGIKTESQLINVTAGIVA